MSSWRCVGATSILTAGRCRSSEESSVWEMVLSSRVRRRTRVDGSHLIPGRSLRCGFTVSRRQSEPSWRDPASVSRVSYSATPSIARPLGIRTRRLEPSEGSASRRASKAFASMIYGTTWRRAFWLLVSMYVPSPDVSATGIRAQPSTCTRISFQRLIRKPQQRSDESLRMPITRRPVRRRAWLLPEAHSGCARGEEHAEIGHRPAGYAQS